MAYATQLQLEQFLQVDFTNDPDDTVTQLLNTATGLISSFIDRRLETDTYVAEVYERPHGGILRLKQWPITTVTQVDEGGVTLTEGTDFLVYDAYLRRINGGPTVLRRWKAELQAIEVTYDAGYNFATDPLVEPEAVVANDTCLRMASRVFQAAAAYASLPAGAEGIKTLVLQGSDSVTFHDAVNAVASTAVRLTMDDLQALSSLRAKRFVSSL